MKIQSRPPISLIPTADPGQIASYLNSVLEIYGHRTGTEYCRVLAEGAGGMLIQMGVIKDFQTYSDRHSYGRFGITAQMRTVEGYTETIQL